jgi:hypothetical protein
MVMSMHGDLFQVWLETYDLGSGAGWRRERSGRAILIYDEDRWNVFLCEAV